MRIRPVQRTDAAHWERMRQSLWPSPEGEHAAEVARFFEGVRTNPLEVLVACGSGGRPIGFVELSIRPEGVAFLEGWYVEPAMRRKGVGAALVEAAEEWGRSEGCSEMGSDTELDNAVGAAAHRALGFAETGRVICFRKSL